MRASTAGFERNACQARRGRWRPRVVELDASLVSRAHVRVHTADEAVGKRSAVLPVAAPWALSDEEEATDGKESTKDRPGEGARRAATSCCGIGQAAVSYAATARVASGVAEEWRRRRRTRRRGWDSGHAEARVRFGRKLGPRDRVHVRSCMPSCMHHRLPLALDAELQQVAGWHWLAGRWRLPADGEDVCMVVGQRRGLYSWLVPCHHQDGSYYGVLLL